MLRKVGIGCGVLIGAFFALVIIVAIVEAVTGSTQKEASATVTPRPTPTSKPTVKPTPRSVAKPTPAPVLATARPTTPPAPAQPTATSQEVAWSQNLLETIHAAEPMNDQISAAADAGKQGDFTTGSSFIQQAQTTLSQAQQIWNAGPPPPPGNALDGALNADMDAALKHYATSLSYLSTGFANQDVTSLEQGLAEYQLGTQDIDDANKRMRAAGLEPST